MSYNTLAIAQASIPTLTQAQLDQATTYLNAVYTWPGKLAVSTQIEDWPRVSNGGDALIDGNGRTLSTTDIPAPVLEAELIAAELIEGGSALLPTTVASATSASTQNREIIEESTTLEGLKETTRWSPSGTTTSTGVSVQTLNSDGLPVIAAIQAVLKPIIDIGSFQSGTNFYFNHA